jgi:hypothetical protein
MKSSYNGQAIPDGGQAIGYSGGELQVPETPIIPFIEGDGTGRDIWKASRRVFDAAVEHAYGGKRRVAWFEVFAGEKAFNTYKEWLPNETVDAIRDFRAERGAAPASGFVFLRATGEVLRGSSLARETPGKNGHRDLPRKHRGRLHRYRVEVRHSGSKETARVSESRNAEGRKEANSLGFGRGNQAHLADRHEAAGSPGD